MEAGDAVSVSVPPTSGGEPGAPVVEVTMPASGSGASTEPGAPEGAIIPLQALVIGDLINATSSVQAFDARVNQSALYMTYLAIGVLVCQGLSSSLMCTVSERMAFRMRVAYMRALLRQDIAFYDTAPIGETATRLAEDTVTIQNGTGEKLSLIVGGFAQFVGGFVLAFAVTAQAWRLALVLLAFVPAVALVFMGLFTVIQRFSGQADDAYARAGKVATEAFAMIRTVAAFGGEEAEISRYDKHLAFAEQQGSRGGVASGASLGVFVFTLNALYGVGLYAGCRFIMLNRDQYPQCIANPLLDECFAGGEVIQVLFALITGTASMGIVAPNMGAVASAKAAARRIWELIDRVPGIDSMSEGGRKPDLASVRGRIEFRNVTFAYPARPLDPVLRNFNLVLEPSRVYALVGPSGCGKSTILALIQRWYDPTEGSVLLDGIDLREYNVAWLRQLMGFVSQEPQLLAGTVFDNIADGKAFAQVSTEEATSAARSANLHDFIVALPQGYQTPVTSSQLSGGQKQRLAIARALVRRAPVLLLDEATSALDTSSERAIQEDLDKLLRADNPTGGAKTAVTVAQRLSTVVNSDCIVVLRQGEVVETGRHDELLSKPNGLYAALWELQRMQHVAAKDAGGASAASAHVGASAAQAAAREGVVSTDALAPHAAIDVHPKDLSAATTATDSQRREATSQPQPAAPAKPAQKPRRGRKKQEQELTEEEAKEDPTKTRDWTSLPRVPLRKLWPYVRPELGWYIVAVVSALLSGTLLPAFSIILTDFVQIFYIPDNAAMLAEAHKYLGIFFGMAVGSFIVQALRGYSFAVSGERMTRRLRRDAFRTLIRQPVGFFDLPENSVGRVATRLGMTASRLRTVLGPALGDRLSALTTLVVSVIIAFIASWRLSLIILALGPLLALSARARAAVTFGGLTDAKGGYAEAGNIAVEATTAVRIVAAFGLQHRLLQKFVDAITATHKNGLRRAWVLGLGFGASYFLQPAMTALLFWAGAQFIKAGNMNFGDMLQCIFALQFGTQNLGNIGLLAADLATLDGAMRILFRTLDLESAIDPLKRDGARPTAPVQGALEFVDVEFAYPARPTQRVLNKTTLTIPAGCTAAIVGPSGSGKSSLVLLLQRFYDTAGGSIRVDGRDLREYDIAWVRDNIAWVQQEAQLWSDSIEYNVAYGRTGGAARKPVPEQGAPLDAPEGFKLPEGYAVPEDVKAAIASANAEEFVLGFRHGYATHVGDRGSQLSGGQKQRVAIARAVVRTPRILLLDEATSALDSRSEAIVQESIDRLLAASSTSEQKRTTLIIAHRLNTIRNADIIFVLDQGRVIETGSYVQLMQNREGTFRKLVLAQDPTAGDAVPPL